MCSILKWTKGNILGGTKSNLWNVGYIVTKAPEGQERSEVDWFFVQ